MSLDINVVQTRVAKFYPQVKRVDENVLCFFKQDSKGKLYATYYLDIAEELPGTDEAVQGHIERVIGARYFEGEPNLQWNNYLYFIRDAKALSDPKVQEAKAIIERDRTYARKFVIDEQGLDALLRPCVIQPTDHANQVDIVSRWIEVLKHPHLIEAIFGQYTVAERRMLIDGTMSPLKQQSSQKNTSLGERTLLPQLRSFKIESYRPCLQGREFRFRDVNLLYGVNGSGKTSLLEAIELYYCGKRTKRNYKEPEKYRFDVQLEGAKHKEITNERPESDFRDRNRLWYGMREQRRSHLYDTFGRFNFLNTDAAVDLARGADEGIEADLSRLLVGSDAAVVWQVIVDLARDVLSELRTDNNMRLQCEQEKKAITKQLAEIATVKKESDSLLTALRNAIQRNEWAVDDKDLEIAAELLVNQLSDLQGVAQQVVQLSWIDSPVTLEKCEAYGFAARDFITAYVPMVQELESLEARQGELKIAKKKNLGVIVLVEELGRIIEAALELRVSELAKHHEVITKTTIYLAGIDEVLLDTAKNAPNSVSVVELSESVLEDRTKAETELRGAKAEAEQFAKVRNRAVALAQQLRGLATDIIGEGPADECPLCHTPFDPGKLARRMAMGVDEHIEAAAQELLVAVSRSEREFERFRAMEKAINRILKFSVDTELPSGVSLEDALSKYAETQVAMTEARDQSDALESEIASLKIQGISLDRLEAIRSKLGSLGFYETVQTSDDIKSLQSKLKEEMRVVSEEMKSAEKMLLQLRTNLQVAVRSLRPGFTEPRAALAEIKERLAKTQAIHSRLTQFLSRFKWHGSKPITAWIIEVETVQDIAVKFQTALGMERIAAKTLSKTMLRKDQLEMQLQNLSVRITRFKDADRAISDIKDNYSLEKITRSAWEENGKVIESIFAQIHSPAEFTGIDTSDSEWALKRKDSKASVPLTRISTGQRAAFALSVFLAQNTQLRAGPPVILIDDPIAHIDDLNCLSFLDYLRDVALTGNRQIFFATASDKLVSLFRRKFEFLGEQFNPIDLTKK